MKNEDKILYNLETLKAGLIFMFLCNLGLLALIIYLITHNVRV